MLAIDLDGRSIELPDADPSPGEPLFDVNPRTDKVQPWNPRKMQTNAVALAYRKAHTNTGEQMFLTIADRMAVCGDWLSFDVAKDSSGRVERKCRRANFCHSRLCPMCAWRRSRKIGRELELVCQQLDKGPAVKALMLTLTVRSVPLNAGLGASITHLLESFAKLTRVKAWKDAVKYWFRGLEVTVSEGTAHPHLHVIIFVENDYFDPKKSLYIPQSKWAFLWGRALRADYKPVVDIRRCTRVIEAAKYIIKPDGFVVMKGERWFADWEVVAALHIALAGRRFIGWSAELVEIRKRLGLCANGGDAEDENLNDLEAFEPGMKLSHRELYGWRDDRGPNGGYRLMRRLELDDTG